MTASSKDQIRAASRFATKEVPIPELGVTVLIRQMVMSQRDEFVKRGGDADAAVWLVTNCVVDDTGAPIWSEDEVRSELKVTALDLYARAVMDVNGMGQRHVEEAIKNLTPDPSSAPDTSSHSG